MKGWLNNATRRAKEGLMQAMGTYTTSDDADFEARTKSFFERIHELNKMKEGMEIWLDSFDSFCLSTIYVGESIRQFYDVEELKSTVPDRRSSFQKKPEPSPYNDIAKGFTSISKDINSIVRPVIRDMLVTNCLRPLSSMLALAPQVQEKIQERRKILFDVESYTTRIHKDLAQGKDFSNNSVVKLASKLDEANRNLAMCQATIYDLFDLFDASVPNLVVEELSMITGCLHHYHGSSSSLLDHLLPKIPSASSNEIMLDLAQNLPSERFPSYVMIRDHIKKIEPSPDKANNIQDSRSSSCSPPTSPDSSSSSHRRDSMQSSLDTMTPIKQELSHIIAQANHNHDNSKSPEISFPHSRPSIIPTSSSQHHNNDSHDSATMIPNPVATHTLLTSGGYTGSMTSSVADSPTRSIIAPHQPPPPPSASPNRNTTNISPKPLPSSIRNASTTSPKPLPSTLLTKDASNTSPNPLSISANRNKNISPKPGSSLSPHSKGSDASIDMNRPTAKRRGSSASKVEKMVQQYNAATTADNDGEDKVRSLTSSPTNLYAINEDDSSNKDHMGNSNNMIYMNMPLRKTSPVPFRDTNDPQPMKPSRRASAYEQQPPTQQRAASESILSSSTTPLPPPKPRRSIASASVLPHRDTSNIQIIHPMDYTQHYHHPEHHHDNQEHHS